MSDLETFSDLFEDISRLKHKERSGWEKKDVERPRDTIASHSFGASILAWILAEKEGLDSDKVVKMTVAHDLMMSRIPDLTPEDEDYSNKRKLEENAIEQMREEYPDETREIFDLIQEAQERGSEEAKIAKKADKLDTLIQAREYSEQTSKPILEEFIQGFEEYFDGESLADKIFEDLAEN